MDPKTGRESIGLNQSDMARAMSVHLRTWSKWERGERRMNNAARQLMAALIWLESRGELKSFLGRGGK